MRISSRILALCVLAMTGTQQLNCGTFLDNTFCHEGKFSLDKTVATGNLAMGLTLLASFYSAEKADPLARCIAFKLPTPMKFQELTRETGGKLYEMIEQLAVQMKIPTPKIVYNAHPWALISSGGLSPSNSALLIFGGLPSLLSEEELRGILASEMARIQKGHAKQTSVFGLISNFACYGAHQLRWNLVGPLTSSTKKGELAKKLLGLACSWIGVPLVSGFAQLALARIHSFEADRIGAEITGNPMALASAILKIEDYHPTSFFNALTIHLPAAKERVKRLQKVAKRLTREAAPVKPEEKESD